MLKAETYCLKCSKSWIGIIIIIVLIALYDAVTYADWAQVEMPPPGSTMEYKWILEHPFQASWRDSLRYTLMFVSSYACFVLIRNVSDGYLGTMFQGPRARAQYCIVTGIIVIEAAVIPFLVCGLVTLSTVLVHGENLNLSAPSIGVPWMLRELLCCLSCIIIPLLFGIATNSYMVSVIVMLTVIWGGLNHIITAWLASIDVIQNGTQFLQITPAGYMSVIIDVTASSTDMLCFALVYVVLPFVLMSLLMQRKCLA